MKAFILSLLVSAFLAFSAQPAHAEYEDGDIVPASVIEPLMNWVEMNTGVHVPNLPHVVASRDRLTEIVSRMGRLPGRARAVYVAGVVVLDHRYFDADDSTQMSLLVHELVHYAQSYQRQVAWSCPQSKEVEAYSLQNKWLEEQGHSPFVRASWIDRMSSCPTTPHDIAVASAE